MFKTREIRWFSRKEDKDIRAWFKRQGQDFESVQGRTDFYLPLPQKDNLGIKLREGRLEVKTRTASPELSRIAPRAEGYMEEYIKWSFGLAEKEPLAEEIISQKKYDWLEVQKERLGLNLTAENGKLKFKDLDQETDSACQIEYTRIKIKNETWFSFGLEWFGEQLIEAGPELIAEITGNTKLKPEHSMGYAGFLNIEI